MLIANMTAYGYSDCRIENDHDEEKTTIHTGDGSVSLAACYGRDGSALPGIAIEVECNNPQGYVYLTPEQLQELFRKFAENSENGTAHFVLEVK